MGQKNFRLVILFSIFSLFFIAGCGKGDTDAISAASPFLGGSNGLEIKFLDGSPPDEITDVSFPFQAIVSMKNVGEHDITKDQVRVDLSGILASDFGSVAITNIQPADDPSARKKDSEGNVIDAVETFATIPQTGNLQLQTGKILGNTKFTFRADVCYQYQTNAIGSICVLSNMIDISNDAICSPKGSRLISGSSSPIRVASLRQSVVGEHKIQFSFDIVHSGSGDIFQPEAAAIGCPKDASSKRTKENRVKVTVNTGIAGLTCVGLPTPTAGSIIILTDGKRTITCTQDVPASDFERNIDIKLEFNYHDSIDKEILAKKLGVGGGGGGTTASITSFAANPTSISAAGQISVLTWNTANAISCTASSTSGPWSGVKSVAGSEAVTLATTTTYTLTCTGASGSDSKSVTIPVGTTAFGCGSQTVTSPRDIRAQLAGTTPSIISCPLTFGTILDYFLISTSNPGPTTLAFNSIAPTGGNVIYSVYQSATCTGSGVASGGTGVLAQFISPQGGATYCVLIATLSATQPNSVATLTLTRT